MNNAEEPTPNSAEKPVRRRWLLVRWLENPTSLNRVERVPAWSHPLIGENGALRGPFQREVKHFLVFSYLPAILMSLLILTVFVLYLALPPFIYAALVLLLGVVSVTFSLWFPRRTFFARVHLKSKEDAVNWLEYWKLFAVNVGWVFAFIVLVGITVGVLLAAPRLILGYLPSAVLSLLIVYCFQILRKTEIVLNLDEYHPSLAGFVADDLNNLIILPARCHKEDSHNIYLSVKPTDAHTSDVWEAELQAAGIKIRGEQTKQHPIASPISPKLTFFWNCKFDTAGNLLVNVLLRTTNKQGTVLEVLRKSHVIHVITLYRQYATTLVTTIIALLMFLLMLMTNIHLDVSSFLRSLGIQVKRRKKNGRGA